MPRILLPILAVLLIAALFTGSLTAQPTQRKTELTDAQRVGYAIGRYLAKDTLAGLERDGVEADLDMLARGFSDGLVDAPTFLDDIELEQTLAEIQREVSNRVALDRMKNDPVFRALAEENLKRSADFIARYEEREGVKELPNGALYRIITLGEGTPVTKDSIIVVTYSIRRIDSVEFDRNERHSLRVNRLSDTFRDIVTHMRVGDHWEIAIPAEVAYGIGGRLPDVGPNEAIIADVRIDDVK